MIFGQEGLKVNENVKNLDKAFELFDLKQYGNAAAEFNRFIEYPANVVFPPYENQLREAQLTMAIAYLRMDYPEAEKNILFLIDNYYPDPVTSNAIIELASYYYNNTLYGNAIDMYDKVDFDGLPIDERSEASFKKGYSYFSKKEFMKAREEFRRTREFRNDYYYPINYYYGMSEYQLKNYESAVEGFRRVSNSSSYGSYVPYYISQIYFLRKEYDLLISYIEQKLMDNEVKNKKELRLLLGQAYYNKNEFQRALPHLEYYEQNTEFLTADEFYQLAFTQYQLGKCADAIPNFLELTNLENRMGMMSNYYLADCYIKSGDKVSGRSVFKKVSQMDFDLGMKEEALFNYGKITAELGYDREAVNVLVDISEKSPYYNETQGLINDLLINSGDYANSIAIIESLPSLSEKMKATYQNVSLKRGMQLYTESDYQNAEINLSKSLKYQIDKNYTAQAKYWTAKIAHHNGEYERSKKLFEDYFNYAAYMNDLPEEASLPMAHYAQAYNYFKMKDYKNAESQFKSAVVGINVGKTPYTNEYILNRILPDAFIRTGDCLFWQRKLREAESFYDQAINRKKGAYVYALLQRATIEGLLGEPYEKLLTLERIRNNYPSSQYADDALMALGETYLELGSPEPAAKALTEIIVNYRDKTPYYNAALLKLGLINYNAGNMMAALEYYKQVINNKPTSGERTAALKAIEEIYIEDLKKQEDYFAFLETIPGFEITTFQRDSLNFRIGENLYNEGEYEKAAEAFVNYISRFPNGYFKNEAHYMAGESFVLLKKYEKALVQYESVISSGANVFYARALKKAAIISFNYTQNFAKALNFYGLYENNIKDENEIYLAQLGALRSAFRINDDIAIVKFANKVNGNILSTIDERATALYYLGKTHYRNNRFNEAIAVFNQVELMTNNNQAAEARYLVAEMYFKQNKYEEAEKQAYYTNDKSRNYPYWIAKSLILLSDLMVYKGDLLNAESALEAVIENFKDDPSLVNTAKAKLEEVKSKQKESTRIKKN